MRRPALRSPHRRTDSGFTLIELMVSMVLLIIMFGMILITMSFFMDQTAAQTSQTQAAANAETSLWTVKVPLRYAETPYAASLANPAGGSVSPTSPCWGTSSPTFDPAMPAVASLANISKAAGGASYGVLGSPADDAILVAHDYDVLFCAPSSRSSFTSPPNIYRLWINPTTCTDRSATGGGGCTLQLDSYGTNPFANCAWTAGTSLPSTCPTAPVPLASTSVATNVWCNLSCQKDIVGTLVNPVQNLTEPPLFTYLSSPSSTTPIDTPSDVTNATGANLPGIHQINVNLGALTGKATATASVTTGTTNSTSSIYLGSTVTTSSTVLDSAPVVTAVSPASGPTVGGGTVTLTGSYFTSANGVSFCPTSGTGCVVSTSFTVNSATSMTAVVPPNAAGVDDVVVASINNGNSATSSADSYAYYPTVTGISPTFGPAAGGTAVTITGTGFAAPATVTFGNGTATTVVVNSTTSITATTPAGSAGQVDTTITELNATSPASAADRFTYVSPATITNVNPAFGPIAGGTAVTITGTNLSTALGVTFAGTAGTGLVVNSVNSITVTTPAHAVGVVNVVVTTTSGPVTATNAYSYVPTVTSLSTNFGTTAGSGGTQITITGTGFANGATVTFGGVSSASVTYVSSTSIKASVPAGAAGTVDVVVTVGGVSSQPSAGDRYTYITTPTVTSVSPNAGPTAAGTSVTISGTSFGGVTTVKFGATNALSFVVNSPTSITAVSPAGPVGTVDVTTSPHRPSRRSVRRPVRGQGGPRSPSPGRICPLPPR
jgi:type II secretory pathway pseudopilin PulG